jgi:hypothetical protein
VFAVEHPIAPNERILHLEITIQRTLRNAFHKHDGGSKSISFQVLQMIVENLVIFAHDPYASGAILTVSEKKILLNQASVAMPKAKSAFDLYEDIPAIDIAAGLIGDAFGFSIASLEKIFLNKATRVHHGSVAITDAKGFAAIFLQLRSRTEVIVMDPMFPKIFFPQPND